MDQERGEGGNYDIIGDLHGCLPAFRKLAAKLGCDADLRPPPGRKLVFVGDLADRGPENVAALRLVARLVFAGDAFLVLGNHDLALKDYLLGKQVEFEAGMDETIAEIEAQPDAAQLKADLIRLLSMAPLVLELAGGALVVAHAGVTERALARPIDSAAQRAVLHGARVGKSPEGRTMRRDWAADYRGAPFIVYGHTPQPAAVIRGRTCNVDCGAYRGNTLSAFRWPELEVVSAPAA